jgi:hypothetical protein
VRSMVTAPARTGRDRRSRIDVINTDQINREVWSQYIPGERILKIVVMKLIAPRIEDIPAK